MKIKRLWAGCLLLVLLLGLIPAPTALAAGGGFYDISDPKVAEAAEILQLLGVVEGTGSHTFRPGATLTRAEFCKLAIEIMDRGSQEPAQRSRTIFRDVGPTHWARGYINLATSITLSNGGSGGEEDTAGDRLIMGVGNGSFEPDRPITAGEAVAILLRILGYNNQDVGTGTYWYDGYMSLAHSKKLLDGLTLTGQDSLTRGQSALLLYNLLFTGKKGAINEDDIYLKSDLKGSVTSDQLILLSVELPETGSNTNTVLRLSDGSSYQTERTTLSSWLAGTRGKLVLDASQKVLAFLPREEDTIQQVSVLGQVEANKLPLAGGDSLSIREDTKVWKSGEDVFDLYKNVWLDLYTGTPLTLCYGGDGKLAYIFMPSSSGVSDTVMVARSKPNGVNPFGALIGGDTGYQIYKNGVPATVNDICQYDVATYDRGAKILNVSDLRLTGRYENVSPNPTAPSRITILGVELKVLPGAADALSAFRPGQDVTLLLTSRGEVASAIDPSVLRTTVVGVVSEIGDTVKVTPLSTFYDAEGKEVVFTGRYSQGAAVAEKLSGQLVRVSSSQAGVLNVSRFGSTNNNSALYVSTRTLGSTKLSETVTMFERVGSSTPRPITFEQITRDVIPAHQILYVSRDSANKVNFIVFDDVTGDQYTYGFAESTSMAGGTKAVVRVINDNGGGGLGPLTCSTSFPYHAPIGLVASVDRLDGHQKAAGTVSLTAVQNVSRLSFDMDAKTVTIGTMVFPISEEVRSYNRATGYWYDSGLDGLEEARAYAQTLTVYYDKTPDQGGKIRLVAVG